MNTVAARLDRGAAIVAVVAIAIWVGGLVALGACAAPVVFRVVPAPLSGDAMGAVFRKFDAVAMGAAVIALGCEAVRMRVREGTATTAEHLRAALVVLAGAAAIYGGVKLSPAIMGLHQAGAVRGFGQAGAELERLHALAEGVAKAEVAAGLLLLVLEITTLRYSAPAPRPSVPDRSSERPSPHSN